MPTIVDVEVGKTTFRYQAGRVESPALHAISHTAIFPPKADEKDNEVKLFYRRPIDTLKPVIVYVMEKEINMRSKKNDKGKAISEHGDFPYPYDSKRLHIGLPNKEGTGTILKPREITTAESTHGGKVVSLVGGAKYGAAQECQIYVVGREGTAVPPTLSPNLTAEERARILEEISMGREKSGKTVYNWKQSFDEVVRHFKSEKKKKPDLLAVMNISVGFVSTKERRQALNTVADAGIIIVAAAGNDHFDFDRHPESMVLPEAMDEVIVIGALSPQATIWQQDSRNERGEDIIIGSNYGQRVDYWLRGEEIPCLSGATGYKMSVTGTSFAAPVAAGVIANMLSSGQASTVKEVRKLLDAWARIVDGRKYLKNAPGLNVNQKPSL
ncbi:protease [Trichoderma arundinaceum]|uniref:Protease n=1 Tax=Trichoderma arundinaceum TaxID=490622 RepID=A0A395NTT5_TRIAR|nr:protease [Trichoderma arundinaceum]